MRNCSGEPHETALRRSYEKAIQTLEARRAAQLAQRKAEAELVVIEAKVSAKGVKAGSPAFLPPTAEKLPIEPILQPTPVESTG